MKHLMSLEDFLAEKVQLKRKYTENYPAITVNSKAKIRDSVLEFIEEMGGQVSETELRDYLSRISEKTNVTKWLRENAQRFLTITESEDGNYYRLNKYGKRVLEYKRETGNSLNEEDELEESDNPFDELADMLTKAAGRIKSETAKEFEDLEESVNEFEISEGLTMLLTGAALSAGKLTSIIGSGISYLGKKVSGKEENAISSLGKWLSEKGDSYTHKIESMIIKLLEITPTTAELMKKLNHEQKEILAKTILTGVLVAMGISAGKTAIDALSNGDTILGAVEGILTGTKSVEVAETVPAITKGIITEFMESLA